MDTTNSKVPHVPVKETELGAGYKVGEYVIEAKIGEGGFGNVFKAVHPLIGKMVAIKVLHRRYSAQPEMVSRFIAEARAVNQIRHRNIIDIFAFGHLDDGRHYYVMEYLEGLTLEDYIAQRGPMPLGEAIPILRRLARALDAAHAKGIAHRDLKPDNVYMVADEDGGYLPKLLDFGIAKLLSEDAPQKHKTRTGAPIGTPQYMSPEQCRGRGVDHRTDIYGFGIMAYRMLTGVLPFDGEDYMDVLLAQLQQEPKPPSSIVGGLPEGVDEAIGWMLQKDPAERPPNLFTAVRSLEAAAEAAGMLLPRAPSLVGLPVVRTSPVAVQGTPPVVTSMNDVAGGEGDPYLPSLAAFTVVDQPSEDAAARPRSAPRAVPHGTGGMAVPGGAPQSGARSGVAGLAPVPGQSQSDMHAGALSSFVHVPAAPARSRRLLKAVLIAAGLAGAVLAGVLVNRMLSPAEQPPVARAATTRAAAAGASQDARVVARSPETRADEPNDGLPGGARTAGEQDPPAGPRDGEPPDTLPGERYITVTVAGPPQNTEVYGPQGLLGVAPGKIQLVRGEESVLLTFKADQHLPETRELVPSQDREIQVELERKRRARSAAKRNRRAPKKPRGRDTIEDPFK